MNNLIWQPLCDKSVTSDYDILYCRLSKDDRDGDESDSISHQKEILADFAAKNGFNNPVFVVDDGFTGTNFQRPGWQLVSQEIENGNVRSIICKNKDRFGRDYLRVGLYMDADVKQKLKNKLLIFCELNLMIESTKAQPNIHKTSCILM
jgi:DNA invertase Pin-like site-specific DNA recombinase